MGPTYHTPTAYKPAPDSPAPPLRVWQDSYADGNAVGVCVTIRRRGRFLCAWQASYADGIAVGVWVTILQVFWMLVYSTI